MHFRISASCFKSVNSNERLDNSFSHFSRFFTHFDVGSITTSDILTLSKVSAPRFNGQRSYFKLLNRLRFASCQITCRKFLFVPDSSKYSSAHVFAQQKSPLASSRSIRRTAVRNLTCLRDRKSAGQEYRVPHLQ